MTHTGKLSFPFIVNSLNVQISDIHINKQNLQHRSQAIAHLKSVLGTVARLLHVHHLQHACVLDLLQHMFIFKVQLLLQKNKTYSQVRNYIKIQHGGLNLPG